jgi:lysophospholipase L1-like esterase
MKHFRPSVSAAVLTLLFANSMSVSGGTQEGRAARKWVASWTTAMGGTYTPTEGFGDSLFYNLYVHPESDLGLPNARAADQTFRMIVKPDLWGDTIRVRFSNVFGDREMRLSAVGVGLQETAAQLVPGTNIAITFGGSPSVVIPKGDQVFSDPIHLHFVTEDTKRWLRGRNLAVSFAISGKSALLSAHSTSVYSYFSRPNSGNLVHEDDDDKFPFVATYFFLVSAVDVLADADTNVICAFGDSITDGGTTVNGYDGWSDVLSRRLHKIYGDKVSVVNMAIAGNTIVANLGHSPPAIARLDRDVLQISGLTSVIWLEGINDLVSGRATLAQITISIRQVVSRLRDKGIMVTGATLTSNLAPALSDRTMKSRRQLYYDPKVNGPRVNDSRQELNRFILGSGVFDSVADMSSATESIHTGALNEGMQIGDYLHPNRAGHEAMTRAIEITSLMSNK